MDELLLVYDGHCEEMFLMLLYQVIIVHELGGVCTRPSLWEGGAYTGLFQQGEKRVKSSSIKWSSVHWSPP